MTEELKKIKYEFDVALKEHILNKDKFVVVCGPCSADDPVAVSEYVAKLKGTADALPNLFIVARIYTAKPRSNGIGYKGLCFGNDGNDMEDGILQCRKMMLDCLAKGVPIADELLYPELYGYFDDLVSYYFIGARSSEDSLHRAFASGLDVPCGIKNGTDGNVQNLLQSVQAISLSTVFPFWGKQFKTDGCSYCHPVLRGGLQAGEFVSNLTEDNVSLLKQGLKFLDLQDFIMADLSHANSKKVALNQFDNAKIAIANKNINGVMVESYLFDGKDGQTYGVSKTDECLSFDDTQKLLKILADGFADR